VRKLPANVKSLHVPACPVLPKLIIQDSGDPGITQLTIQRGLF
jgi:hypothetical protein